MDLSERRHDLRHDVPVPFASDPFAGYGVDHRQEPTGPADLGAVVKARAIQCALSRICALCGLSLRDRPSAHDLRGLGRRGRGEHVRLPADARGLCGPRAGDLPALGVPVLGQRLVLGVGGRGDGRLRARAPHGARCPVLFHPNSVIETRDRHHRVSVRGSARWPSLSGLRTR